MLTKRFVVAACIVASSVPVVSRAGANDMTTSPRGTAEVASVLGEMAPLIARNRQGPTRTSRLYGIVGYSMLVASNVRPGFLADVTGGVEVPAPSSTVDDAIAAVAAGTTAVRKLMPTQLDRSTFAQLRDELLSNLVDSAPEGVDVRASIARGVASAGAVLVRAKNDGFDTATKTPYKPGDAPGAWVPTAPGFQAAIDPGWGTLRPYLASTNACVLPEPPTSGPTDDPYRDAAKEVADVASSLTDEQQSVARFWDDGRGRSSTPSGHWVAIAGRALVAKKSGVDTTIATFGAMSMALADSVIANWREKYKWNVERPITALSRTDTKWTSYLTTPAFPEYPSGHSTISRVASDVLTASVGEWSFTDDAWGLTAGSRKKFEITPRTFDSFRAAADEAGGSRIYGGIHYRFSIDAGAELGTCVATPYAAVFPVQQGN